MVFFVCVWVCVGGGALEAEEVNGNENENTSVAESFLTLINSISQFIKRILCATIFGHVTAWHKPSVF